MIQYINYIESCIVYNILVYVYHLWLSYIVYTYYMYTNPSIHVSYIT